MSGNLSFLSRSSADGSSLGDVHSALMAIPSDDRDTWLKVGMALKSEFGESAFEQWNQWSQRSDSYKERDALSVWKSLNASGGIALGTLFFLAYENGWKKGPYSSSSSSVHDYSFSRQVHGEKSVHPDRAILTKEQASRVCAAASAAGPDNPYLLRKFVQPFGELYEIEAEELKKIIGYIPMNSSERLVGTLLVVPIKKSGELSSLEFIDQRGLKSSLPGSGTKQGGYWVVGDLSKDSKRILIAEGVATALSAHAACGEPVISTFSLGNIGIVSGHIRSNFPSSEIVLLADLKKGSSNPTSQVVSIAKDISAKVAVPDFGDSFSLEMTDFNDLHVCCGLEKVKSCIDRATFLHEQKDEEWPELISIDFPELPSIDKNSLPSWAGRFAEQLSRSTETPLELAAGLVLSVCSAAIARRATVQVKPGYRETCNLWVAVALPPGNRKSAVQSAVTRPFVDWERAQAKNLEEEISRVTSKRKTLEARVKNLRSKLAREEDPAERESLEKLAEDIEASMPIVPAVPQLWTSDATPERLGALMSENYGCMAWLSSEGGVFDSLKGRYSNGIPNLDLVLKAHSGDPERVDRGSRPPVILPRPLLTLGLSPQPEVLRGLAFAPGFRGRGLLGRFLYLLPASPLGYRSLDTLPVSKDVIDDYSSGVQAILNWKLDVDDEGKEHFHRFQLSAHAQHVFHEYALEVEREMRAEGCMTHVTDWAGKAPGAAARIAAVLHGIEHAHDQEPWAREISSTTMNAAVSMMRVVSEHSLAALGLMGSDPSVAAARTVWGWIQKRKQLKELTVRELFSQLRGSFPKVAELNKALEPLVERGYLRLVEETDKTGPGRKKSPTVEVRPDLCLDW